MLARVSRAHHAKTANLAKRFLPTRPFRGHNARTPRGDPTCLTRCRLTSLTAWLALVPGLAPSRRPHVGAVPLPRSASGDQEELQVPHIGETSRQFVEPSTLDLQSEIDLIEKHCPSSRDGGRAIPGRLGQDRNRLRCSTVAASDRRRRSGIAIVGSRNCTAYGRKMADASPVAWPGQDIRSSVASRY